MFLDLYSISFPSDINKSVYPPEMKFSNRCWQIAQASNKVSKTVSSRSALCITSGSIFSNTNGAE